MLCLGTIVIDKRRFELHQHNYFCEFYVMVIRRKIIDLLQLDSVMFSSRNTICEQ